MIVAFPTAISRTVRPEKAGDTKACSMRGRKLTRAGAIEEYLMYQIRLFEYLQCFQVVSDIERGKYKPQTPLGHGANEFRSTLFNLSIGLFASLIDPQDMAVNVFDVWLALYPKKEQRILDVWKKIKRHIRLISDFRNDVAFHTNKNLRRYLRTRGSFNTKKKEVLSAMQEFWTLAAELRKEQDEALPDFAIEIDPILKKAVPAGASGEQIDKLKSIFF
jgi:hypothetical protein